MSTSTSSQCRAKDPHTCPYHGAVLRMEAAQAVGDFDTYFRERTIVEGMKPEKVDDFFDEVALPSRKLTVTYPDGPVVSDEVEADGIIFYRRRPGVFPNWPYAMRFQANRKLSDDDVKRMAGLVGYSYRRTVAGEPLSDPVRDSDYSFYVFADTTKTASDDLGMALERFEGELPGMFLEGSDVRKTDRAGAGTKGTRLIDGFNDPGLKVELYYDDVVGGD